MSASYRPPSPLVDLLATVTERTLEPDQRERLNRFLRADADARDFYVRYVGLHTMLDWHYGEEPVVELPLDERYGDSAPSTQGRYLWWTLVAVAVTNRPAPTS